MSGPPPLIGRQDALRVFSEALGDTAAGAFRFVALVGEPGTGKTRLLGELAAGATIPVLGGRAAEFERELPFGVVVDALDDHLASAPPKEMPTGVLATVFPALSGTGTDEPDLTGLARHRLYRAIRQLLEELAREDGLVLILDDVHWADETSIELLDHLVRHPPRGRILIAVGYRPAQASPRLATLVETAGDHGRQVTVNPLTAVEVERLLGPQVSRARCRYLYSASGGNPFYLEALSRMGEGVHAEGVTEGELPAAVRAALQAELTGLSATALLVAQAAAVAADEFEPALAAVAADVDERAALAALDEMAARDVVRTGADGRFRFRHPLVRNAAYGSAAAGWRHGVHTRVADHLAGLGVPATVRARHVERSGRFGDEAAIATLVEAARTVAEHGPATAAHWLQAALRLMPQSRNGRLALQLELAQLQTVSGRLPEGRENAREVLRLLPAEDLASRARAARFCAMIERLLDRPQESRALLLAELRQMPDPQSAAAVQLRLRLVAESLMRVDFRAAQAVLDLVPDRADGWEPSLAVAVAALRPMPAYTAGRISDATGFLDAAARVVTAAPDEQLAEWIDAVTWLCWTELFMGRYHSALRRFERALDIANATGQIYIVTTILAGQARAYAMLGRLAEAAGAAEEAAEVARLLHSGQSLTISLAQQSLVAGWSGDSAAALRFAEQAVGTGGGRGEWAGAQARYAWAMALIGAGRLDEGAEAALEVCDGLLESLSSLSCCEVMASVEAARGRHEEAAGWAARAAQNAFPELGTTTALARLAGAHTLRGTRPAEAALLAAEAAGVLAAAGQRIDAGRAQLVAGLASADAGDRTAARDHVAAAAELFLACGALTLHAQAVRELRRLGVRVPGASGGRGGGPGGLSQRELEVARLAVEGNTNQQIAEKLVLSIRTVETHLSHVFTKLGVSSRVGVVNALRDQATGTRPELRVYPDAPQVVRIG